MNSYEAAKACKLELTEKNILFSVTRPEHNNGMPWKTGRNILRGHDGDLVNGSSQIEILKEDQIEEAKAIAKKHGLQTYED